MTSSYYLQFYTLTGKCVTGWYAFFSLAFINSLSQYPSYGSRATNALFLLTT